MHNNLYICINYLVGGKWEKYMRPEGISDGGKVESPWSVVALTRKGDLAEKAQRAVLAIT